MHTQTMNPAHPEWTERLVEVGRGFSEVDGRANLGDFVDDDIDFFVGDVARDRMHQEANLSRVVRSAVDRRCERRA